MREPDYAAHPPLDRQLTLPADAPLAVVEPAEAVEAWSAALGGAPVLLVRSVERARALLLEAAGIQPGESIAVPANASRSLVESIKASGGRPRFLELDAHLGMRADLRVLAGARVAWAESPGGLAWSGEVDGASLWVDHADTLPMPGLGVVGLGADVMLWGLHLSSDPSEAGALVTFADTDDSGAPSVLRAAVTALLTQSDAPDSARALTQCRRLTGADGRDGLAARQRAVLEEIDRGLAEAVGLELLPWRGSGALPSQIAVRIPDECDVATFYAYVLGENTPVRWLPLVRPVHHAALRCGARVATADHVARWLLVPVGPRYTDVEIEHAVLGVVKASEYLGVRWRTDPARAVVYARMLDDWYGPDHDAYKPVFIQGDPGA